MSDGGTIDWKSAMPLLRSGEGQFPLLLELKERTGFPHPLDAIQEVFRKLEEV